MSGPETSEAPAFEELLTRIRAAFADLTFVEAELIEYGDDNLVVVLDSTWVVRFPRNQEYRARFVAELNLLQRIATLSPLAVPIYERVASDRSFGAYRMIVGREMTPEVFAVMTPQVRRETLAALAAFLSALHALPAQTIAQPDGLIARTWTGDQFAALYRGMRRAKIARVVSDTMLARFDAFHDAFESLQTGPARLVHGDVSDDHILVDEAATHITGIIDFSDASFGDPAIDFAYAWRWGEGHLDAILRDYHFAEEDRTLKTRARWTFVRYLINQLAYGQSAKWHQSVERSLAELEPHLKMLGF